MSETREPHTGKKKLALGALILLVALAAGGMLWWTAPKPERRPREPRKPLVEIEVLERIDHRVELEVHGRVEPVTRIELVPQVAGSVTEIHPDFVPGGYVPAGETIVAIDDREYRAALRAVRAELQAAEEELKLERGRRRAAQAEWRQFSNDQSGDAERDLATRGPQLRMRQAAVERAKAALQRAELEVEWTRIAYPYPVIVESIDAALGTVARIGQSLGTAYPLNALWIDATLPVRQLKWFKPGDPVEVWGQGAERPLVGTIREIGPDVQPQGSLGRMLVEVPVEGGVSRLPLRAGEFVRMKLQGRTLDDVFRLPRRTVHGAGEVRLVSDETRLEIRPIKSVYSDRDYVVVREGLSPGQRLVVSPLERPVEGMSVRIAGDERTAGKEAR